MHLIDTHTHLYQPAFDGDREEAMNRCQKVGVDFLLLPNIDVDSVPRIQNMIARWPNRCRGMMGLHPCHVKEGWEKELRDLSAYEFKWKYYIARGCICRANSERPACIQVLTTFSNIMPPRMMHNPFGAEA